MDTCIGGDHSGAAIAHQDKSSSHCLIKLCCMSKLKQGRSQVRTQLARECLIILALIDGFSKSLHHQCWSGMSGFECRQEATKSAVKQRLVYGLLPASIIASGTSTLSEVSCCLCDNVGDQLSTIRLRTLRVCTIITTLKGKLKRYRAFYQLCIAYQPAKFARQSADLAAVPKPERCLPQ